MLLPCEGDVIQFETGTAESVAAAELLRAYAAADGDLDTDGCLNRLFAEYVGPWCAEAARRILRRYGVSGVDQSDEEAEVAAEVMLHMTARLREMRRERAPSIGNLRAYAITAVYNSCFARIRARCPRHLQLRNRIRYMLRNDRLFAAWTSSGGEQLTGLSGWAGREDYLPAPVVERSGEPLQTQLRMVFSLARAPLRLDDLIGAAAGSLGIGEIAISGFPSSENFACEQPAADRILIGRQSLAALWNEVVKLPQAQRVALLLNLRDVGGHGAIELIFATGTATFKQLAAILNITTQELSTLWDRLPLRDAQIAEMLEVTSQQVINLRKSARDRLARRQRKAADRGIINSGKN